MPEENFKFKEKWYVSNVFLGILLVVCSVIPFAVILGIPLVILKTYQFKKVFSAKCEDLNTSNGEIHRLKELISPDAKKLEEIRLEVDKLKNKATQLNTEITEMEQTKEKVKESIKQIEQDKKDKIREIEEEIQLAARREKEKLSKGLQALRKETEQLDRKIGEQELTIDKNEAEIIELRDEILLQSFSLYRPQYDFVNSAQYKNKLDEIREHQKQMIKQDMAALGDTNWTVNNNACKGKKMVNDTKKLLLRAFNSECEFVISKVRYNNFDTCLKRIKKASETISKLGVVMNISIHPKYYELKVQELRLALEYQQMKQREKEEQ